MRDCTIRRAYHRIAYFSTIRWPWHSTIYFHTMRWMRHYATNRCYIQWSMKYNLLEWHNLYKNDPCYIWQCRLIFRAFNYQLCRYKVVNFLFDRGWLCPISENQLDLQFASGDSFLLTTYGWEEKDLADRFCHFVLDTARVFSFLTFSH